MAGVLPLRLCRVDLVAHPLLTEYGELLLMTPDRSRILRAYPFRDVPPQWLLVTPRAVYCGRQGDGGVPNSMVCRVDRSTGALTVVVFPSPDDFATNAPPISGGLRRAASLRRPTWELAAGRLPYVGVPPAGTQTDRQRPPVRPGPQRAWRWQVAPAGSGDPEVTCR